MVIFRESAGSVRLGFTKVKMTTRANRAPKSLHNRYGSARTGITARVYRRIQVMPMHFTMETFIASVTCGLQLCHQKTPTTHPGTSVTRIAPSRRVQLERVWRAVYPTTCIQKFHMKPIHLEPTGGHVLHAQRELRTVTNWTFIGMGDRTKARPVITVSPAKHTGINVGLVGLETRNVWLLPIRLL